MSGTQFNYELLFDLSTDLLCIAGYDGYFKKINPAVSKTLGYTMEELYARPINDFVYEDDKQATESVRQELTKTKPLVNFENRYVTKNGEIVWLSWTSHPSEEDQLIFAIAKNITHKKAQEAERNARLADLTKINENLKQLSYTTSHDLRAPINNLMSIVELIDVTKISDTQTSALLKLLKLTSQNVKKSLDDYVDGLSTRHLAQAKLEEISFDESLSKVLRSISSLIQTSHAVITASFDEAGTVKFNRAYLESVFLNLITNSIKYAKPGQTPVISISSELVGGVKKLTFADNGLGFDMDQFKDKIFGLHQKFHHHSDSKGVGLYLVHSHITSLGGHIAVESKVNEGAKFIISFRE